MKTFKNFQEANVVNIDTQIASQVKRHKAIKGKAPQDAVRKERIRDTIERMRDRRNALTGKPKSEPVESMQYEANKYSHLSDKDLADRINDHKSKRNKSGGGVNSAAYMLHHNEVKKAEAEQKLRTRKNLGLKREAKEVSLDDLDTVDYTQTGDPIIKRNAKRRKKADVEHESVQHDTIGESKAEYRMMSHTEKKAVRDAKAAGVGKMSRKEKEAWIDKYIADNHIPKGGLGSAVYSGVMKVKESVEEIDEVLNMQQRRQRAISLRRNKAKIRMGVKRQAHRIADKDRLKKRATRHARTLILKKFTKGVAKSDLSPARKAELEKRLSKMKGRIDRISTKILPQVRKDEIARKRG